MITKPMLGTWSIIGDNENAHEVHSRSSDRNLAVFQGAMSTPFIYRTRDASKPTCHSPTSDQDEDTNRMTLYIQANRHIKRASRFQSIYVHQTGKSRKRTFGKPSRRTRPGFVATTPSIISYTMFSGEFIIFWAMIDRVCNTDTMRNQQLRVLHKSSTKAPRPHVSVCYVQVFWINQRLSIYQILIGL